MDCIKYLNSYDEIVALVDSIRQRRIYNPFILEHYRGQGRPEYQLVANVSRTLKSALDVRAKEEKLLSNLQQALKVEKLEKVLRIDDKLTKEENLWNIHIQAQHLGVPTRLLDWSLKWEVGLWFAVENPKNDDVDGQFWVFSVPDNIHLIDDRVSFYDMDIHNLDQTYFINAPIYWSDEIFDQTGEIRRMRQHGKFSISPYVKSFVPLEDQAEVIPHLEKYCIPAKIKEQLRLELTAKGIYDQWLYYRERENENLNKIIERIFIT
jgi:hypothetical protein